MFLTLSYVVGLAAFYSVLGVIAGLTGTLFGTISTNPWLYFAMANLLLLAALMMFEVIPVPVYYPEATHILGRPVEDEHPESGLAESRRCGGSILADNIRDR